MAGLEFCDVPEPEVGQGDVKIKVHTTGICGTDLHILNWDAWASANVSAPLTPGHEFYGEVIEIGDGVHDVRVGDRVSGEGHVVCEVCRNCRAGRRQLCIRTSSIGVQRDGAFAEYVVIPQQNVWIHKKGNITAEIGAIFDPMGNAVHTALKFPLVGEDVLITGAGPIGLMAAAVARFVGARYVTITDVSPPRLALAERMGVDAALDVRTQTIREAQQKLGMSEGFDVALEMSGQPAALREAVANMNHGGKIALLGIPTEQFHIDWAAAITRMLTLQGIYGREMFETWHLMSAMLTTSQWLHDAIRSVITDVVPAGEWERGFEAARAASSGKVVLDWR